MSVKWHKLGEYIEECDERNDSGVYGVESVRGISIEKKVIETKADMTGVSLAPYKLFKPNEFCFVTITSRNGGKISLACNESEETYLVSSSYEVFRIKSDYLLPGYLSLLFRRPEFDRYARFNSWGSAREAFSYEDMCRVEIPVPPIEEQRKVVETWQGLRRMKEENEKLAEPLLALCRSYLQECKKKYPMREIGPMIEIRSDVNSSMAFNEADVMGVSNQKSIIATKAKIDKTNDLSKFTVVRPYDFVYNPRNGIAIGLNEEERSFIISFNNTAFYVCDDSRSILLPEFLMLWFRRSEWDRRVRVDQWGSSTEVYSFKSLCRTQIALPPIEVQQAVVDLYRCANEAKKIAAEADRLSREICPALIQKVAREA